MYKAEGHEKYVVGEKDPPKGCSQLSHKTHGHASILSCKSFQQVLLWL